MIGSPFFHSPLDALEKSISTIQSALRTLPDEQLRREAHLLDQEAEAPTAAKSLAVMQDLYRDEIGRRAGSLAGRGPVS